MLIALDTTVVTEYTLKSDTGEPKTIFELGLFDSFIASRIQTLIYNRGREIDKTGESDITDVIFETVRHGLRGVKNLGIEFESEEVNVPKIGPRRVVSDSFLRRLKIEWIVELYNAILSQNFLSEQDSKNSVTPSA